ncbi:MAG: hypothetical protein LUF86_02405, partial [Clostridiales bacterium]|nr:hypothetical protein [Clostridiales bacterium]
MEKQIFPQNPPLFLPENDVILKIEFLEKWMNFAICSALPVSHPHSAVYAVGRRVRTVRGGEAMGFPLTPDKIIDSVYDLDLDG